VFEHWRRNIGHPSPLPSARSGSLQSWKLCGPQEVTGGQRRARCKGNPAGSTSGYASWERRALSARLPMLRIEAGAIRRGSSEVQGAGRGAREDGREVEHQKETAPTTMTPAHYDTALFECWSASSQAIGRHPSLGLRAFAVRRPQMALCSRRNALLQICHPSRIISRRGSARR
jgi:hypothetical protein